MILRRMIEHVRTQNWTAVALDFVIVVVGVLIAFQISSEAERRGELATFDRQMQAFKGEMLENLGRYEATLMRVERQFADITRLRQLLDDPDIKASESEIDALIYSSIGVIGVYTKRNSLDVVLSSDLFSEVNSSALIDAIERWEEKLSQLNRVQQDALRFRDNRMHTYFTEHLAYASAFATAGLADGRIAPSKARNSRADLSGDRVLDNILAGRQLTTLQDIAYTGELAAHTREIIRLIDDKDS
ncbi:MAG: hypothetical protein AAF668_12025 [Pseudomonadota bacterium]